MLRPTQINYPDGGETVYSYYSPTSIDVAQLIDPQGDWKHFSSEFDGLGRQTRTAVTNGEPSQSWDQVDICYDADGRISFRSYTYQSTGFGAPAVCSGTTHIGNGDSYAYYATGYVQTITHSDGSTISYSSPLPCIIVSDEQGKKRTNCTDGGGRLTSVTEDPGGLNYLTNYSYDANDNLTSVNQSGQTRSFTYDSLSRLAVANNPESGQTSYTYDANGNVLTKTDARGIVTNYSPSWSPIDALNRVTATTYTDGTPTKSFGYDQSAPWGFTLTNPVGRLTTEYTSSNGTYLADSAFSYDPVGRVNLQAYYLVNNGVGSYWNASANYNFLGSPTQLTYPSGRVVKSYYNFGNRPYQVTFDNWNGTQIGITGRSA